MFFIRINYHFYFTDTISRLQMKKLPNSTFKYKYFYVMIFFVMTYCNDL